MSSFMVVMCLLRPSLEVKDSIGSTAVDLNSEVLPEPGESYRSGHCERSDRAFDHAGSHPGGTHSRSEARGAYLADRSERRVLAIPRPSIERSGAVRDRR